MKNKLEEFDPNYYIDLADRQKDLTFTQYESDSVDEINDRAALNILSENSGSARQDIEDNWVMKRDERLLRTDLLAKVPVELIDVTTTSLRLHDGGIPITYIDGSTHYLSNGQGSGYYISVTDLNGTEVPLVLDTVINDLYIPHQEARRQALNLLGEDDAFYLTAFSIEDKDELKAGYITDKTDLQNTYFFSRDNSSVNTSKTANSLVIENEVDFNLVSDSDEISDIVAQRGFATMQVNISIDDPILNYVLDSETFSWRQKDVSFKNFLSSKSTGSDDVLSTTIPSIIIISPGNSPKHSPSNGESSLGVFTDDETDVHRTLRLIPHIDPDYSKSEYSEEKYHSLDLKFMVDVNGLYYRGLIEERNPDIQSKTYVFDPTGAAGNERYKDSYISFDEDANDLSYTSTSPTSIDVTPMRKLLIVIEDIKNVYNIEKDFDGKSVLTWRDIFRRLNSEQINTLLFSAPSTFWEELQIGDWQDIRIRDVLQDDADTGTGLVSEVEGPIPALVGENYIYIEEEVRVFRDD